MLSVYSALKNDTENGKKMVFFAASTHNAAMIWNPQREKSKSSEEKKKWERKSIASVVRCQVVDSTHKQT